MDEIRGASVQDVTVRIYGEKSLNAALPASTAYDLSSRTKTSAYVDWTPPHSTQIHELLFSPDISTIVQEIVNQGGWISGNPMAFLIEWVSGTGSRWTESYYTSSEYALMTGGSGAVPALEIRGYLPPISPSPPPPPIASPPPPGHQWPHWSVMYNENSAEEDANTGSMYISSSDLELPFDGGRQQVIGIIFPSVGDANMPIDASSDLANTRLGALDGSSEPQEST